DTSRVAAELGKPLEVGDDARSIDPRHVLPPSDLGSIEPQRLGQPLQCVRTAIVKAQPGPGDKVAHGGGNKNLAAACELRDARRYVNGDTADVVSVNIDFARMETTPDIDAEWAHLVDDRRGAAHGTGRTVKGRKKPVAQGLDLTTAKPSELLAHRIVMAVEQIAPSSVAKLRRPSRRVDDVSEQHRRQHPIELGFATGAGQKLLDLVDNPISNVAFVHGIMVYAR